MNRDLTNLTVTVKTTLKKFNGNEAFDPAAVPVEVIEREEVMPLSALPPQMRMPLLKEIK